LYKISVLFDQKGVFIDKSREILHVCPCFIQNNLQWKGFIVNAI